MPKTWQALQTAAIQVVRGGRTWRGSGFLRLVNGESVPVRLFLAPNADAGDEPGLAFLAAQDDSRVQNMQTVLRHEQRLLHVLFDTLPDAIYFKDEASRFLRTNTAMTTRLGAAQPEDLVGRTDADFFTEEHAAQARADEQRVMSTGSPMLDVVEKETWPDGHVTWVSSSKFPLRDWRGEIVGTFGLSRDITAARLAEEENRRIEQQLFAAQKMESIGRLAAGIAHEINTPTQFINDNTRFLSDAFSQLVRVLTTHRALLAPAARLRPDDALVRAAEAVEAEVEVDYLLGEIPRTLDQTMDGISRVARIVRSLTEYAHPGQVQMHPADLNRAIATAVAVSRHEWKTVAEVTTLLDPTLSPVPCVIDQINQVLLNLIVNAAHTVTDAIAAHPESRGRIELRTRQESGCAVVEIEDTGVGIPLAVQPHIFEPFFTTKAPGRGTGQGLALVHTMVVKNHGGTVGFTSIEGKGSTFRITLPLSPTGASEPTSA